MRWLFAMTYAHWMIVAGALLIAIGFIGFAFRQNRDGEQGDKTTEINGQGK